MQELAALHEGSCLSLKYTGTKALLKWSCSEGHEWEASYKTMSRRREGCWCKECPDHRAIGIEKMREIAASHGGECLSDKYVNSGTKLKWRCSKGHEWEAVPSSVNNRGSWCKICSVKELTRKRNLGLICGGGPKGPRETHYVSKEELEKLLLKHNYLLSTRAVAKVAKDLNISTETVRSRIKLYNLEREKGKQVSLVLDALKEYGNNRTYTATELGLKSASTLRHLMSRFKIENDFKHKKNCFTCGEEFETNKPNEITCSKECSHEKNKTKGRIKYYDVLRPVLHPDAGKSFERECEDPVCGEKFIDETSTHKQRYCSKYCQSRHYVEANFEKTQAYKKWYREENKEAVAEGLRRWYEENPDYNARKRAILLEAVLPSTDWERVNEIYKERDCMNEELGLQWPHPDSIVVDHMIALIRGGAHHQDNLRLITSRENSQKKDKYIGSVGGVWADNERAEKNKKKLGIVPCELNQK